MVIAGSTNRYVVTNQTYYVGAGRTNITVGADVSALSGLVSTYDYGGKTGFGRDPWT